MDLTVFIFNMKKIIIIGNNVKVHYCTQFVDQYRKTQCTILNNVHVHYFHTLLSCENVLVEVEFYFSPVCSG